jgi:glutathione S-transferase
MHLVELPMSLYSFKLRLALRFKAADVETRPPPGGSYRSPEFAEINPAGSIPALVDGDFWLAESDAIIEYLDEIGLGSPLLGADPRRRARDRMLSRWVDMRLEPAIRRLFAQIEPARRDKGAVAAADASIASSLAIIEKGLDGIGPFAGGAEPGLADCGLAAALSWLGRLQEPLRLESRIGPRAARAADAVARDLRAADEVERYGALVDGWLASRFAAPS